LGTLEIALFHGVRKSSCAGFAPLTVVQPNASLKCQVVQGLHASRQTPQFQLASSVTRLAAPLIEGVTAQTFAVRDVELEEVMPLGTHPRCWHDMMRNAFGAGSHPAARSSHSQHTSSIGA
jgi:hypothetical protein